jgi:hypothetical protein
MDDDELRLLRETLDDIERALGGRAAAAPSGGRVVLARTVSAGSYPTAGAMVYAFREMLDTGAAAQGAAVALSPTGDTFYAANFGVRVPAEGSDHFVYLAGGRGFFRHG